MIKKKKCGFVYFQTHAHKQIILRMGPKSKHDIPYISNLALVHLHFNSKVWKFPLTVSGQYWESLDLGAFWIFGLGNVQSVSH